MEHLVERASRGDREAFTELASNYTDPLFAIARRILQDHDRAEDAVQSALLRAWRDLPTLRDHSRFQPWLHRLLVHACYDETRMRRAFLRKVHNLQEEPNQADSASSLADRDEIERAFDRLSLDHRAVVVLHYYRGFDLIEVSDILGVPAGTVRSRLHYALRVLRADLEAGTRDVASEGRPA